ncbi:cysteine hydrolase [Ligilactobacillus animalis]|uniref:cysteine hydrolase family protein n=1 Tax=Ligilactobacillus animalis TaxID=1605 RepID=UPI0010CA4F8C|nr:isochorismatase family cysteine hydrolase [Ligilactobacillus animalis]MDY2993332.1 isochorismatase family cysteine hydrolase [Ligilactobacillus animalis]QCQ04620.1 cysteine hydrolase [Ligilactobacillus animalis]
MKKALLIIDYTNDFIADDGTLSCKEPGQAIEESILKLADTYLANGDYVILPTDTHQLNDKYHPESKLFPPHNIEGTWGHQLYGKLAKWYQNNQTNELVWQYSKDRYSSFQNTGLDNFLRTRKIDTLCLTGVCTDICVLHTAVDAYDLNYSLEIPKNAVASFDQIGHEWALRHFESSLGAKVY